MAYKSIFKTEKEPVATTTGYKSIFGDKKVTPVENQTREVGLPEHLGGGRYLTNDSGDLILSKRSQSALPSIGTSERDHIISVALGGVSTRENLQYLATTEEGRQAGKVSVEQKAINDYTSGRISLEEARGLIAAKQQEIKGLTPKQGLSKGFKFLDKIEKTTGKIGDFLGGQIDKIVKGVKKEQEALPKTTEERETFLANRALSGLEGPAAKKMEVERVKQGTSKSSEEGVLKTLQEYEKETEKFAKVITAPIRYTVGSLASLVTSYALERADEDKKYTPKTDAEKLIISEIDVQRLTKQEDLYGTIARGAGVPVALMLGAIIESPFLQGTGASKLIKTALKKYVAKISTRQLTKLGIKEIIKIADDVIEAEIKAGKLEKEAGAKAIAEIKKVRVVEPTVKPPEGAVLPPKTPRLEPKVKVVEPLELEAKKFKTADEFVKAQGKIKNLKIKNLKPFTGGSFKEAGISKEGRQAVEKYKTFKEVEPIKISPSGIVEQGHHRVLAAIENGQTTIKGKIDLTKSQLTDIWKKAQEVKPTLTPKIATSIQQKAIDSKLVKGFDKLPEVEKVNWKEQAQKNADLFNKDLARANNIIDGKEALPSDYTLGHFLDAAEQHIKLTKDTDMAYRLANSKIVSESSKLAQQFGSLGAREKDSLTKTLGDIKNARKEKAKSIEDVRKTIKKETSKNNLSKEDRMISKFLDSIKC